MTDSSNARRVIAINAETSIARLVAFEAITGSQGWIAGTLPHLDHAHAKGRIRGDADAQLGAKKDNRHAASRPAVADLFSGSPRMRAATKDAILVPRRGLEPPQCCHR